MNEFEKRNHEMVTAMSVDMDLQEKACSLFTAANKHEYSYHFRWLGRPIIQYPQDIVAIQELIWEVQPDLIIETGVAHGGSLILSASILELIGRPASVLGIDIDIRAHNRVEIERHPMSKRIHLIQGSSICEEVISKVRKHVTNAKRVLVFLDSNHEHEHVLKELELYSPLVSKGSYVVVFDTVIEDLPAGSFPDRPWDKGSNPMTAVFDFLKSTKRFVIDKNLENKLLLTVAPNGYLRCVAD